MAERELIREHYPEARLMKRLGMMAIRTPNEAEAEAFVGALAPLTAQMVPRAESSLMRAAPQLVQGLSTAARVLRSNPATRSLVGHLPTLARRTAIDVGRQLSRGQPAPPEAVVRALARQAVRVLGEDGPERYVGGTVKRANNGYHPNILHWRSLDEIGACMRAMKWEDIRTDQAQVAGGRTPVPATGHPGSGTSGSKRPDVQGVDKKKRRVHVEVDTKVNDSGRHEKLIFDNDANTALGKLGKNSRGVFIVQYQDTGQVQSVRHVDPLKNLKEVEDYGEGVPLSWLLRQGVLNHRVPRPARPVKPAGPCR